MATLSTHESAGTETTVASDRAATEHTREPHLTTTGSSTGMQTSRSMRNATELAQHVGLLSLTGEWLLIFRFVGAHDLENTWACPGCKPSWIHWYCKQCSEFVIPTLPWTPDKHFGWCNQTPEDPKQCPCCRYMFGWKSQNCPWRGACDQCHWLWVLKTVSPEIRLTLSSYNGR